MDRRLFITLGLSALGACGRGGKPDVSDGPSPAEMIDSIVANGFAPAAGLVVRKGGKTIFSHGAGIANGGRAFRTDTKMRVASVSKLAVALTAHRLAERGELDLDATDSDLPEPTVRPEDPPKAQVQPKRRRSRRQAATLPAIEDEGSLGGTSASADQGTIKVRSTQRVLVKVNGTPVGHTPIEIRKPPGTYVISASPPGRNDQARSESVTVGKGGIESVSFDF